MKWIQRSRMLRRSLIGNAVFSGLSGILILISGNFLSVLLGPEVPGNLSWIGYSLLLYTASLIRSALRKNIVVQEVWTAIFLDVAWVAGTLALVAPGRFNPAGNWVVLSTAGIVLLFAILQHAGLRRLSVPANSSSREVRT